MSTSRDQLAGADRNQEAKGSLRGYMLIRTPWRASLSRGSTQAVISPTHWERALGASGGVAPRSQQGPLYRVPPVLPRTYPICPPLSSSTLGLQHPNRAPRPQSVYFQCTLQPSLSGALEL